MLDHAAENGCGVPAFNVNNLKQIQAIMEAVVANGVEPCPDILVVMHQDHGTSAAVCQ